MEKRGVIDPMNSDNHGVPLWVVYGEASCFPEIICAKLRAYDRNERLLPIGERGPRVCIWGYSVYKRKPGFRTLGVDVQEWAARFSFCRFYVSQDEAIEYLRKLVTPRRCEP